MRKQLSSPPTPAATRQCAMKKRTHHGKIDRFTRSSHRGKRNLNARAIFELQVPESVTKAYDSVQSLVKHEGDVSLEELQGAVEYLLDRVKAARGLNG
jgi:hypothetical protein